MNLQNVKERYEKRGKEEKSNQDPGFIWTTLPSALNGRKADGPDFHIKTAFLKNGVRRTRARTTNEIYFKM